MGLYDIANLREMLGSERPDDVNAIFDKIESDRSNQNEGLGPFPKVEEIGLSFGDALWKAIKRRMTDFGIGEDDEELLEIAHRYGKVERVIFDPEVHGEHIDAELGDEIWYWRND